MSPTVLPAARKTHGLRGYHVAGVFFAFFAAVFVVNGAMIYSAISTYSGVVSNEPYRKGLHYNDRIAADERQARLGWSDAVDLQRDGRLAVTFSASDGRPVTGLLLDVQLGRPTTSRQDAKLSLREAAPGRYEAVAGALDDGAWIIALEARTEANSTDPVYRMRRRLWLKP